MNESEQHRSRDGAGGAEVEGDPRVRWRETLRARSLDPGERREVEAWLARNPGARADWALEVALADSLRTLPDVPVATNFTASVLRQVRQDEARAERASSVSRGWRGWLGLRWLPVAGGVAVLLTAGLVTAHLQGRERDREYARQVAALRVLAEVPTEALSDYDAIRRYGETLAPVDFGLLAAME